ncbi:unnamed protein product [Parnassius apollo]|uniref:(apollo) hypothetical protein n=1 Tax=Parnassius apollo TaxID=110799 RepID=A0A8S3WBC8_PARAO|nr:unnamed protein product [Parnassius apollo]
MPTLMLRRATFAMRADDVIRNVDHWTHGVRARSPFAFDDRRIHIRCCIMDAAQLIAVVQEYEELYNLRHLFYSNQQRRDNIWEEVGRRLNKSGNACKERWTRIRDKYRKALNLRKTKSGQAASKIKAPKFSQKLSFLTPYLNDEEERRSNLSPRSANNNEETQLESLNELGYPDNNVSSDVQSEQSMQSLGSSRIIRKKSIFATSQASQDPTAASVLQDYLSTAETRNQSDPLLDFFINMAKTLKTFPLQDQVNIRAQLFKMVNNVEMRLATTPIDRVSDPSTSGSNVRIVSNVMLSPAPTGWNSMFPQSASSNTTMFAAPAMNETLHILPLEPSTVYSRSSTPNERPMMSPPDTSQSILEDKNNVKLGQYLRLK